MKISQAIVFAFLWAWGDGFAPPSKKFIARSTRPFAVIPGQLLPSQSISTTAIRLAEEDLDDEDDDDDFSVDIDGPLSKGIDSVSWLPTTIGRKGDGDKRLTGKNSEVIPLFPLGGIVYIPNSEQILNIFEPRYRQMYSDILMDGTKKFVVSMSHPSEAGRFAETGVLFELDDLREVSEQTGDKIKYICSHKVTGRVKIHRIINPEAWEARDTYLRVEATVYDDSGKNSSNDVYGAIATAAESDLKEEKALRDSFTKLVDLQHDLEEDVRFTRESAASLATKPGPGTSSLWQTVGLWHSFADQRLMARQNELQKDFQKKLQEFLKKQKGLKENELPSFISFQDLSPELQKEVKELQKRTAIELQPLMLESSLSMQKILEAPDHTTRLQLLRCFIESETKRLNTKKALQNLFSSKQTEPSSLEGIPPEELLNAPEVKSSFYEDDDAFQ